MVNKPFFFIMRGRCVAARGGSALLKREMETKIAVKEKQWNRWEEDTFRFKVTRYSREKSGRERYTVTVVDGPLYETHKSMTLTVMEQLTKPHEDGQINVFAFNRQIACYEDAWQDRFQGWVAWRLVKKIREREADWEWDWTEMQLTIVRVMWRYCHALPVENVCNVVRECRAHWRSLRGPHDSEWKNLNLGTRRIERVIVRGAS